MMGDTLTAKELYELVDKIECCTTPSVYYYFVKKANKHLVDFFKDYNHVILMDGKGRKWYKGKRVYDDGRNNNT